MPEEDKSKKQLIQEIEKLRTQIEKLESSRRFLNAVMDNAPVLISAKDLKGTVIIANKRFDVLEGPSAADFVGKSVFDLFPAKIAKELWKNDLSAQKGQIDTEESVRHEDGQMHIYHTVKFPLFGKSSEVIGTGAFSIDITEKKIMEDKLRQDQKMKALGNLSAGIAHEFNNMLFAIIGNVDMLLGSAEKNKELTKKLEAIKTASTRASHLVKQVLTFSRNKEAEVRSHEISGIVREAVEMVKSTLPANIEFKSKFLGGKHFIPCDETQINEVVLNLCGNSIQAMEEGGGLLEIYLKKDGKFVKLMVRDTGGGIKPEVLSRIFEPFFTTKDIGRGTGLGLSVVHGIVQKHNGRIEIDNEFGKGCSFSVFFPITAKRPKTPKRDDKPKGKISAKILIVEDEVSVCKVLGDYLESKGLSVTLRANGRDAWKLFQDQPGYFDLVFTDQSMPYMTGEQLITKIRQINKDLPIIMASGFVLPKKQSQFSKLGISAFLVKPFELEELYNAIVLILR